MGATIEIWESISNSIPDPITNVMGYPCSDYNLSILLIGAPENGTNWCYKQCQMDEKNTGYELSDEDV